MDRRHLDHRHGPNPGHGNITQHHHSTEERGRSRSRETLNRSRGGGRGQGKPKGPIEVITNFFRVRAKENVNQGGKWILYSVEIQAVSKKREIGPDGNCVFVPKIGRKPFALEETGTTPLSRRILLKLQRTLASEDKYFATDGSHQIYAPLPLFSTMKASADEPIVKPEKDFHVQVLLDCEEDDPCAKDNHVSTGWFMIKLQEVRDIEFEVARNELRPSMKDMAQQGLFAQCMQIVIRNQLLATTFTCGRSPRLFYFPEDMQGQIGKGKLSSKTTLPDIEPELFVGITQALRFCANNNTFVISDFGTGWFNLEKRKGQPQSPIPILDSAKRTFAGIHVADMERPIPEADRSKIQAALEKLTFHVMFEMNLPSEKAKWLADRQLPSSRVIRPNQRLVQGGKEPAIVWSADDKDLHKFEHKGVEYTVAEYFLKVKGTKLAYPKMPILNVGKYGFNPAEFFFQAFGRAKGANRQDQALRVLGFHDAVAGETRIEHVGESMKTLKEYTKKKTGQDFDFLSSQFNFTVDDTPEVVQALVLDDPVLSFGGQHGPQITKNGSWRLTDGVHALQFNKPSDLPSFAVLDLGAREESKNEIIISLLKRCKDHGMQVTTNIDDISNLVDSVTHKEPMAKPSMDRLYHGMEKAIKKARDVFLFDSTRTFWDKHIMFKTWYSSPGDLIPCLVCPFAERQHSEEPLQVVFPPDAKEGWTTDILTLSDGREIKVRLFLLVENCQNGPPYHVDPFDFRWSTGRGNEGLQRTHHGTPQGTWEKVRFLKYQCKSEAGEVFNVDDPQITKFKSLKCEVTKLECPSIVFVILPTTDAELYNAVKLFSYFCFGIPSQCIVKKTFNSQRNKDQYFSNIALKLNTKLSSKANGGCAWNIGEYNGSKSIPWLAEVPTLVMGIALSHDIGKDGRTVVAASAIISQHNCMQLVQTFRVQSKSEVVLEHIMKSITKVLAIQFYNHTGRLPERVLVFRDGASEGQFPTLMKQEVLGVRVGLYDFMKEELGDRHTCTNACVLCTPKITFVVCINNHNVRIVPKSDKGNKKNAWSGATEKNVWSGTTVDDPKVMPFQAEGVNVQGPSSDKLPSEKRGVPDERHPAVNVFQNVEKYNDFLLTAQQGLKGTSKPVFYRVVLNENLRYRPDGNPTVATALTKEKLQKLVYLMSFQYGTATKAVRRVPVVGYSKRLAEIVLGCLPYLTGRSNFDKEGNVLSILVPDDIDGQKQFVWKEMQDTETDGIDYATKNELLPRFCGSDSIPRRPHPSA